MCIPVVLLVVVTAFAQNSAPIVGILGVPSDSSSCATKKRDDGASKSCFGAFYVKWLEQSGARVVPIPHDADAELLHFYSSRINGYLFTGGDLGLALNSTYVKTAQQILSTSLVKDIPVWGTCQGFQLLHILVAQSEAVLSSGFDAEDISLPLDFNPSSRSSKMYSGLSDREFSNLHELNITMNFHRDGVLPETYKANKKLSDFFTILSTNKDRKGREFISSVEAKSHAVFGSQYHPERQAFEFNDYDSGLNHTLESVRANNALGQFFVERCRKNINSFGNISSSYQYLIYNYPAVYEGGSNMIYYF